MKKSLLYTVISFVIVLFCSNETKAQSHGYDHLGLHCIVDVSLSDPIVDGYATYTIPAPSEGFFNGDYHDAVSGPGSPFLFNHLGATIDLKLRLHFLQLEVDSSGYGTVSLEMIVNKWVDKWGNYHSYYTAEFIQCHYEIKLHIMP